MSIERFLEEQNKNTSRHFKDMAGRLLSEKEVEDTRPWKWEEELTDNDWEEMKKTLEECRTNNDWTGFINLAALIYLLDPNQLRKIKKEEWGEIDRELKNFFAWDGISPEEDVDYSEFAQIASFVHILDPHRSLPIDEGIWSAIIREKEESERSYRWPLFVDQASALHIIDPDYQLQIDTEVWDQIEKKLDQLHGMAFFCNTASSMRLLDNERARHIKDETWEGMENDLEIIRNGKHWNSFASLAFDMRVLAAHKVEVTTHGILITDIPPVPLDTTTPRRPMRKKI